MVKYVLFCAVALLGLFNLTAAIFSGVLILLALALLTPTPRRPANPYKPHDPSKVN